MNITQEQLDAYLSQDIYDFYFEIGVLISESDLLPLTKFDYIEKGKQWFLSQMNKFSDHICSNEKIKNLVKKGSKLELFTALCDLLSSILIDIAPWTMAGIIIKTGISKLCSDQWEVQQ